MKTLFKIMKKIIISSFLLYIFNYFAVSFNFVIPINLFSVAIVSIFDVIGLIGLILFKTFIMWGLYGWDY